MGSAIATGLVGVVGVLVGLFAERMLQRIGKLRCETGEFRLSGEKAPAESVSLMGLPVPPSVIEEVRFFNYSFNVKLFNEKDVSTGLRDIAVVFHLRDGRRMVREPHDQSTQCDVGGQIAMDPLEVVNLPSHEWVSLELFGTISADMELLVEAHRVEFRGYLPTGRVFKREITKFPYSWLREGRWPGIEE